MSLASSIAAPWGPAALHLSASSNPSAGHQVRPHRIQIERPPHQASAPGATHPAPCLPMWEAWAQIALLYPTEAFAGWFTAGRATHRISLRYRPGVLAGDQVHLGGALYRVFKVVDYRSGTRELVLLCRRV